MRPDKGTHGGTLTNFPYFSLKGEEKHESIHIYVCACMYTCMYVFNTFFFF